jgi:hypothetical protein
MSGKVNRRDVNRAVNWACYTVTINLALLVAGVLLAELFPAIFILVVAGVGLVTLFGVLMTANFLSEKLDLNKGEMRKALAASLTISFLTLMAILAFAGKASPPQTYPIRLSKPLNG